MAIIELSGLLKSVRGRVTGDVLYPLNKRQISRTGPTPTNPSTAIQQSIRGFLGTASAAYNTITPAQAAAWATLADSYTRKDMNGSPYNPTPKGLFTSVNFYRLMFGAAVTAVAPSLVIQPRVADIIGMDFADDPFQIFKATAAVESGLYICECSATLPGTIRKARPTDILLCSTSVSDNFMDRDTLDLTLEVETPEIKFVHALNDRIGMTVISLSDDYLRGESFTKEVLVFT